MKIEPQDGINRVFPAGPATAPLQQSGQDNTVQPVARTCPPELRAREKQVRRETGRKTHRPSLLAAGEGTEDVIDRTPRDSPYPRPPSK